LAIGHQRHYSYLYANALEILKRGDIVGDVRHIRAFWHRNQTAGGSEGADKGKFDSWSPGVPVEDQSVDFAKHGYDSVEELIRWRLSDRTGGGLMVELGSHQLDACSIMLGKIHPNAVSGAGVTSFFTDGRAIEDHIFLTYEFPGDVVSTYSSICTNAFDKYGEQVMGTKGTLILEQEKDIYLFKEGGDSKNTRVTWAEQRVGAPVSESTSTTQWVTSVGTPDTLTSRGYREEQEHFAYCIRNPSPDNQPRCNSQVALDDAVVALCSNMAMREKRRIEFKHEWFEIDSDEAPETEGGIAAAKS
jgi:predicted dehydrogenase